jgi:hypothetical protein
VRYLGILLLILTACSPDTLLTEASAPEECSGITFRKEITYNIDEGRKDTVYVVTSQTGESLELTSEQATVALADPIAACADLSEKLKERPFPDANR